MMNKRGLSAVVTTVLIILLSIVAIVLIWVVVRNVITTGGSNISSNTECINLALAITNVSYSSANDRVNVTIQRDAGAADLKKVRIVVGGNATDFASNIPLEAETRTFSVGGVADTPAKVDVAGILGASTSPCKVSDSETNVIVVT